MGWSLVASGVESECRKGRCWTLALGGIVFFQCPTSPVDGTCFVEKVNSRKQETQQIPK